MPTDRDVEYIEIRHSYRFQRTYGSQGGSVRGESRLPAENKTYACPQRKAHAIFYAVFHPTFRDPLFQKPSIFHGTKCLEF